MDQKKLRIVFLSRYSGKVNRGVETHVAELQKLLTQHHHVDVFSGSDADNLTKVLDGHYDIVIPTNGRWQALMMSCGRLLGGYKTIIAGHAGIGRDDLWNIVVTCPNVFVALTDAELKWAKNKSWLSRMVKIPNGIDLNKFSAKESKIEIDLPRPIVLSVGALEWYKHHEQTIEAVSKLKSGSLLIIGAGPLKEYLEKLGLEKLGLERFKIIKADYAEMPNYYRSADIFTLPSWNREAFGIVYLEALASGLPVVAPNDDSRKEIVGNAGILVDTSNSQKFADALQVALDKKWNDLPKKQAEKFSWQKVADQYLELFQEMTR